jgi:predicted ribosome quality control (RQC) complex YloA/Tae2 family protein
LDWQTITFPEYERERVACQDLALSEFMQRRFWGIDLPLARMIEREAGPLWGQPDQSWREFSTALNLLRSAVDPQTPVAIVRSDEIVPVVGIVAGEGDERFSSLSAALAALDARSGEETDRTDIILKLRRELEDRVRRLRHRVTQVNQVIADGAGAAQLRRQADLLGAQRHKLRPGMSEVSLEDLESGAEVTIRLDPALRPQENIDALYRRAGKALDAAQNAQDFLPSLIHELESWEARLKSLENPSISTGELDALRKTCGLPTHGGYTNKRRIPKRLPYREFRIGSDVVWVGRSGRDNDQLTARIARPDDLFLHASHSGGAHVILRRESRDRDFGHEAIIAAAQVAAFFSKAKHSHLVPVIYTEARHVRKPRKAPPGSVQVTKEKSVMVRPLPPPGYHDAVYKE